MAILSVSANSAAAKSAAPFQTAKRAADPFAQVLAAAAYKPAPEAAAPTGFDPTSDTAIQTGQLRQQATLALAEFKRTLKSVLHEAGIDTKVAIRLEPDGSGGVSIVGQHPDRNKIARVFEDNPDLAAKFCALAKQFTEMRAGVQSKSHPLIPPTFGLSIKDDEVEVAFQ